LNEKKKQKKTKNKQTKNQKQKTKKQNRTVEGRRTKSEGWFTGLSSSWRSEREPERGGEDGIGE
jgi:hypothetical protein